MLLKPVVPLVPVTLKDSVVVPAAWSVVMFMGVICELVMLPASVRSTVPPPLVVAGTVVGAGVAGTGVGVAGGGVTVTGVGVG